MRVLDGRARAPDDLRGASIALGVLDGVHRGHQAVLAAAAESGAPLAAAVFEPHPRHYFQKGGAPFRLQSATQRARTLLSLGAEAVFQIPFDQALAAMSEEAFAREIVRDAIGARHVCVGRDFRFGHNREGDAASLRAHGEALGFAVTIVPDQTESGARISSTAIRTLIAEGEVARAAALLGRPFAIEGAVATGQQRGRTINFPTANVALGDYVRPKFGVYAVRVRVDDRLIVGVANVGVKPTAGEHDPLLEAHLFDFDEDLYGQTIEASLIAFIRPEQKFESFDALRAQIAKDAETARRLLG